MTSVLLNEQNIDGQNVDLFASRYYIPRKRATMETSFKIEDKKLRWPQRGHSIA